jgi:type VI secretion system protein ImpA
MSIIDVDALLSEVPSEALRDETFVVDRAWIQGEIEKDKPNWREIQNCALKLLTRTHDLELAVFLTRAVLHNHKEEGLLGLRDGLQLLYGLIERYWETVEPRPEDRNDPYERINVLMPLAQWKETIIPLMNATLCSSPSTGSFGLRHVRIAQGNRVGIPRTPEEESNPPRYETLAAAFTDCNIEKLQASKASVVAILAGLQGVETQLAEKICAKPQALDLSELRKVVEEMDALLAQALERRAPAAPAAPAAPGVPNQADSSQTAQPVGLINSRKDVIRALEHICTYYVLNEPASPVPLLLKRALRLVEKNFFEIMQDLAPDSVAQIKLISGIREEEV